MGEVPTVILPLLVSPMVELAKEVLAMVVEPKSHLLLKLVQLAEERHPACEPEATLQEISEVKAPMPAMAFDKTIGEVPVIEEVAVVPKVEGVPAPVQ